MSTLPEPAGKRSRVPAVSDQRPLVGGLTWLALGAAAALLVVGAWLALAPGEGPDPAHLPSRESVRPSQVGGRGDSPARRDPLPSFGAEDEEPTSQRDAAESEDPTGLALFPAPGTDPPRRGIIVPEDFVLPPGYVRHYQATDGGARLPAILMFHPDYRPVDAHGTPVRLPADRVVPPEWAPPGLPVRMLELPNGSPEAP